MSKFIFTCPYCQKQFYAQEEWIGESTDCPNCRSAILITKEINADSLPNRMSLEKILLLWGIALAIIFDLLGDGCIFLLLMRALDESLTPLLSWCGVFFYEIFYLGITLVGISLGNLFAKKYQKIGSKISAGFIAIIALILGIVNLFFWQIGILYWFIFIPFGIAAGKNITLRSIPKYSFSVINQREFAFTIFCWFISMTLLFFTVMQWIQLSCRQLY